MDTYAYIYRYMHTHTHIYIYIHAYSIQFLRWPTRPAVILKANLSHGIRIVGSQQMACKFDSFASIHCRMVQVIVALRYTSVFVFLRSMYISGVRF